MFKLLVIDIDGVMTDGTKIYDDSGNVTGKRFNDRDFTAIKMFKKLGVKVCFLSGDRRINFMMATNRKIDFWDARSEDGTLDKGKFLDFLCTHYQVTAKEIAYIGDDLYDIPLLTLVGWPFCPASSPFVVTEICRHILWTKGGEGAIMELLIYYCNGKKINIHDLELKETKKEIQDNL